MCFKEKLYKKRVSDGSDMGRPQPLQLYLTKYETSFSVREHIHVFSLLDSYTLKSNLSLVFWWLCHSYVCSHEDHTIAQLTKQTNQKKP